MVAWLAPVRAQSSFGVRIEKCNFYGNGSATTSFDSSAEILIGGSADITRDVLIERLAMEKGAHFRQIRGVGGQSKGLEDGHYASSRFGNRGVLDK